MKSDSDNYQKIFLSNAIMMDIRAPVEFSRGSFPNAVNLPLLNDNERTAVGTCYKEQGLEAALELGHHLVSDVTKAERLHDWAAFAAKDPQGYLFCFRVAPHDYVTENQYNRQRNQSVHRIL